MTIPQINAKDDAAGDSGASSYAQRNLTHIGYTLLENGEGACLLVPFVPGMGAAWVEGSDVHIQIGGGEIVLLEVSEAALKTASHGKLIVVGVDALSRPVFEGLVESGATRVVK